MDRLSALDIDTFKASFETELTAILNYWQQHTIDHIHGGFVGQINHHNQVNPTHSKGIILNTRILWAFSRANNFYGDQRYKKEAKRAFEYLRSHFLDRVHGGFFWEVDYYGQPVSKRKQTYAQAFAIYALAEYYKCSKNLLAKELAMTLFQLLEAKTFDPINGGYFEAFGERWEDIEDVRLSEKEINAPKTTNTHLHILEAYTTLLEISADDQVRSALVNLLTLFRTKIIGPQQHLRLFFSEEWQILSSEISFGHDIEAAWLLIHAARTAGIPSVVSSFEEMGEAIARTFLTQAIDKDGGVINDLNPHTQEIDTDRHWWAQIEAMVGLVYVWQISENPIYLERAIQIWQFTKKYMIDHEVGEWYWRVDQDGNAYEEENKVGPWKCPYHNSRGLMEILELLKEK